MNDPPLPLFSFTDNGGFLLVTNLFVFYTYLNLSLNQQSFTFHILFHFAHLTWTPCRAMLAKLPTLSILWQLALDPHRTAH